MYSAHVSLNSVEAQYLVMEKVSHLVLQINPGLFNCVTEGTNQSQGLNPQEINREHKVGQELTQHWSPTRVFVVPFQVELT